MPFRSGSVCNPHDYSEYLISSSISIAFKDFPLQQIEILSDNSAVNASGRN